MFVRKRRRAVVDTILYYFDYVLLVTTTQHTHTHTPISTCEYNRWALTGLNTHKGNLLRPRKVYLRDLNLKNNVTGSIEFEKVIDVFANKTPKKYRAHIINLRFNIILLTINLVITFKNTIISLTIYYKRPIFINSPELRKSL